MWYNVKKKHSRLSFILVITVLIIVGSIFYAAKIGGIRFHIHGRGQDAAFMQAGTSSFQMSVHFIDVGQGDSILIQCGGENMLIDAGTNESGSKIADYLNGLNITRLKYVIGTHPHEDHIGGLDDIIRSFDTDTIILPPIEHTTKTFEDVLDAIEDKSLTITLPKAGAQYLLGNAILTIIAPNDDYGDDLNNWSVGIKITNGKNSFVMAGDAGMISEYDMCENGIDLSADVLKLNHHGSKTSTSEQFLKAVHPWAAVISCGVNNSYGHPAASTLKKLQNFGCDVYRTDEQGTIIAVSDGTKITFNKSPSVSMTSGKIF